MRRRTFLRTVTGSLLAAPLVAEGQQAGRTKFLLTINLKTARALGLTIPPSLLQRIR